MICLGNELRSFCHFWNHNQVVYFGFFCWLWGYSISSKRFLPTAVDIIVIWVKFTQTKNIDVYSAISCLTTSNLPWFMDLTFQVPMQYCSLQHRTLLPSLVTSTTGCCFCFGSIPSIFLELFLQSSPVAYGAPTDLGRSSFSVLSFCLFILFTGFSRQEYWSGLPFPSQWTTFCQNSPPWPVHLEWPYTAWLIVSLS